MREGEDMDAGSCSAGMDFGVDRGEAEVTESKVCRFDVPPVLFDEVTSDEDAALLDIMERTDRRRDAVSSSSCRVASIGSVSKAGGVLSGSGGVTMPLSPNIAIGCSSSGGGVGGGLSA